MESIERTEFLVKIKIEVNLNPQHIGHMLGFLISDNGNIAQKDGFTKPSFNSRY